MDRMLSSYVDLDFHGSVASWDSTKLHIPITINTLKEAAMHSHFGRLKLPGFWQIRSHIKKNQKS